MAATPILRAEIPADAEAVSALIDRVFGPGRYAKSAERLREGNRPEPGLSFVCVQRGVVVGSVRLWPIRIGEDAAILLGPIGVAAGRQGLGLGARLVRAACQAADKAGLGPIVLVGDEPWFGPFGFAASTARGVVLPGPVDPRRVLARGVGGAPRPPPAGLARPA